MESKIMSSPVTKHIIAGQYKRNLIRNQWTSKPVADCAQLSSVHEILSRKRLELRGDNGDPEEQLVESQTRKDTLTDCTLLSTVHGRDRRALRGIHKKDLQAAVKYGHHERTFGPIGQPRWMHTFADIVYITDDTGRVEITSWALPVEIFEAPVSSGDIDVHEESARKLRTAPHLCTSHIVSMKKCDVADHKTRSDAVFGTIALDLIGHQIDHADTTLTDAVTLIEMRDYARTVFEREPLTNVLFNKMLR
eukprot:gene8943-12780_t